MDDTHAAGERSELPPRDRPGSDDGVEARADVRTTVADLQRRERALTTLLQVSDPDTPNRHAAVEALATVCRPVVAGVAMLQEEHTDLQVDPAWFEGAFVEPFSWNASPTLLREVVGSDGGEWHGQLTVDELPGAHLLAPMTEADLHCESVRRGGDVIGLLFAVECAGEAAAAERAGDLSHLIAARLSAEIDRHAERRAQRQTEQQFNDVAMTAFDWFWEMDCEYRFTYLSDRWREITGRELNEYLGKTMTDLGVDPAAERWSEFFRTLDAREPLLGLGTRTMRADGEVLYWKVNGKPFYNEAGEFQGYRGTGTDVSAEVKQRRRAEKAEAMLLAALQAIPQGVVLFDDKDRLVISNQTFKEQHPEIADDLVAGAEFVDLVALWAGRTADRPDGMSVDELFQRRVKAHRTQHREFELERSEGRSLLINERKTADGTTVWLHTDVTVLKQREVELQQLTGALERKNDQMDATINAMTDGLIMYDADDRIVLCNDRFRGMFEVSDGDVVEGMPSAKMVAYLRRSGLLTDQIDEVSAEWDAIREHGHLTFRRRLGDGRVLEATGIRMADNGIAMTFHDITVAENQAQALSDSAEKLELLNDALAKKNAYFDATLNSMIQGLATFDPKDRLMVCNGGFRDIFNLPRALLSEGTGLDEIAAHVEKTEIWDGVLERVASTHALARKTGFEERKMRLKDGRSFEVQNTLLANGDLLVTFHDITALENHAKQLTEYADKLEFSNRELEEFASVASHDLQEPLRKIEAFGDRLRRKYSDALGPDGQAYLDRMQNAAQRMRSLIQDLLDYSRITAKAKPFETISLVDLISDVVNDLEIAIEASSGVVHHGDLPGITGDPVQIRQVFQNLISNAIKFHKPGQSPVVEITGRTIAAGSAISGVEISIADNGIGFDRKYADEIFKIFHRLHGRGDYEGTGIGLATCRKIMGRHGGAISARSEPGAGTTVTLTFPAHDADIEEDDHG